MRTGPPGPTQRREVMRKLIITAACFAALAIPTAAMASAPDGSFDFKANGGAQSENASIIGKLSSQIKQNGQFVSGNSGVWDQTTSPGSRAALVQDLLGH
jgi:hypothetical protein